MNQFEAVSFFKALLQVWEKGKLEELLPFYHEHFQGKYNHQPFDLQELMTRFDYVHQRYANIHCRLIELMQLDDNKIFSFSHFYGTDDQMPSEIYVSNVTQIKDNRIEAVWTLSTHDVNLYPFEEFNKEEDLSIDTAAKKRFKQVLNLVTKEADKDVRLTTREIECLYLYISGLSAKEIAKELGLSFKTIENHLANIKDKYQVSHKSELKKIFRLVSFR